MLKTINLTKHFNGQTAVNDLNLTIASGEIYCLLGANGAGKTTTINMLLNVFPPSAGKAMIGGMSVTENPLETKKRLTYIPENLALYPNLTGAENLRFFCGLSGLNLTNAQQEAHLTEAGLQPVAIHKRVETYSKGMRQKVGVALAIARSSDVLLLDEPTSGLDPAASNDFARLLEHMKDRGAAVLMATHDLFRAKETGTRIGIMNRGKLMDELNAADISHSDLEQVYLNHMKS
ncbi:MAG: ABC transporter ATP-binding protein [Bacteroidetes bacterium]|nr:ABC transporter ATP-binding protein [Bacteroidota bacterium]MCH8525438.1 ABC transporter ATP-binding protein [Balneolales bacterium]